MQTLRSLLRWYCALVSVVSLSAMACLAEESAVNAGSESETPRAPLRMLALGDSYTIGESVAEAERWPVLLAAALRERGLRLAPPRIIARTGWSTAQLASAIEAAGLEPPYDLVTLLIGVNDQFRAFEEETYPQRVEALLAKAVELAGGTTRRVIMVSIPDYGPTPFGARLGSARISAAIDRYNATNRDCAGRAGIVHIDITEISREAAGDPELIARDGLHPSGKMYRRWARKILPLAERALRGDTAPAP